MSTIGLLSGALVAALTLAACGSSSSTSSTGGPNSAASNYSSMLAFSRCMRSHGVPNFPDPGSGGGIQIQAGSGSGLNPKSPAFQSAQSACRSKLPNGGKPPHLSQSQRNQMLAFSQCMRSHGVPNFPDPQFGNGGGVGLDLSHSGVDPNSPQFKSAQSACGSPLGKGKGGGGVQLLDKSPG